jgi:hypothetical protein
MEDRVTAKMIEAGVTTFFREIPHVAGLEDLDGPALPGFVAAIYRAMRAVACRDAGKTRTAPERS